MGDNSFHSWQLEDGWKNKLIVISTIAVAPSPPSLDMCHVTRYNPIVIETFADHATKDFYISGRSKQFPPDVWKRAVRRLEYLDLAVRVDDLLVPPSNRLHKLEGDRKGRYSISVNDQWRICFRFENGHAYDVELTDYH